LRDAMSQASCGCQVYKPRHGTLSFSRLAGVEMARYSLRPGEEFARCRARHNVKIKEYWSH
jgi:hypothetical protein